MLPNNKIDRYLASNDLYEVMVQTHSHKTQFFRYPLKRILLAHPKSRKSREFMEESGRQLQRRRGVGGSKGRGDEDDTAQTHCTQPDIAEHGRVEPRSRSLTSHMNLLVVSIHYCVTCDVRFFVCLSLDIDASIPVTC